MTPNNMTVSDLTSLVPIVSATTALLAVIFGPFVTLWVAKRQISALRASADLQARASVLSKSRQEWINTLRIELAGFISSVGHTLPTVMYNVVNGGDTFALTKEIRFHHAKVKLLINPAEADHLKLIQLMDAIVANLSEVNFDSGTAASDLASLAQKILKREWERVKLFQ